MNAQTLKAWLKNIKNLFNQRLYSLLALRFYSIVILGALFCTIAAKFFHSCRTGLISDWFSWILTDIAVLLGIELVLATTCFIWPRKLVIQTVNMIAAVVCTWSVINAFWLIRTGTQILPGILLPLLRDPISITAMVCINIIKMPIAGIILLTPSAIAIAILCSVIAKPIPPSYNSRRFISRAFVSVFLVSLAVSASLAVAQHPSASIASDDMRYNCHLMAVEELISAESSLKNKIDIDNPARIIPAVDQIRIPASQNRKQNYNVVLVVLEGVQYKYTSLCDPCNALTPYMAKIAQQGVEFTNTRANVTNSSKALFAIHAGRYPSFTPDIAEAVPSVKTIASVPSVLRQELNYKTAFFTSSKGEFECLAGLAHNLGFDKFWSRENLDDHTPYIGYMSCDDFTMLNPITEWIKADPKPFCLTLMCSITHDPYEVPKWFSAPAKNPLECYQQTINYTDKFLAALDSELEKLNLKDNTIVCIISDHAEAFGEHGLFAHERILFDEVLRIPWVIRAPGLITPAKITTPVTSVDLAPTLLTLLGFDTNDAGFNGANVLAPIPKDRKIYFSGWTYQSPIGCIQGSEKFIYDSLTKATYAYDLTADPIEKVQIQLPPQQAQQITDELINFRINSVFKPQQEQKGEMVLFDNWYCKWNERVASAKYRKPNYLTKN